MQQEKLLKMQAVNKLAEIMNRKDMNISNKKQKQSTSADLRKKEKECRKLQQDLNLVRLSPVVLCLCHTNTLLSPSSLSLKSELSFMKICMLILLTP